MSAEVPRRGRSLGRTGGAAVAAAAVATVVGAVAGAGFGFDAGARSDGGPADAGAPLPPASAQVTRQTLVDSQTEDGELGHGDVTSVSARLAGTVTALPATGATVSRGEALYRVDDTPVVLLYGPLPAYRELSSGTEGADVAQWEQNLAALGYRGFTVDDRYTSATAAAVADWQEDLGLPRTGRVEPGRIVYAGGPVRVDAVTAQVGGQLQPGGAVLGWTGLSRVVTVELDVSDQRLAQPGSAVGVTLPDGREVPGRIAASETVIEPAEGQEPETTKIEVTVTIDDETALVGLDRAAVQVDLTASQRADVLTVPVAALLALAEGGYGVEVLDGATSRIVAVQTGLFADGRVEVSGAGVAEGTTVGMPA